jgi:hypothetical protein
VFSNYFDEVNIKNNFLKIKKYYLIYFFLKKLKSIFSIQWSPGGKQMIMIIIILITK